MEKVYMQITSGRGPAECCRVVALVLEKILKQAAAKGVKTEIVERETGPLNHTLLSAVISLQGGDYHALIESAELFEMLCREQDCWGKARSFATDHARFQYFHAEDGYIDYIPHDNFRCEVILLSGLPGMGKDHYIRTLPQDIPVISLDAIRRKYKVNPTDKAANGRVVQKAKEEARN